MTGSLAGAAVIFDLDGTLIDTAGDLAASMNFVLMRAGRAAVPLDRVRHLVGHGARAMLDRGFCENGGEAPADLDPHVALFLEHYLAHIADQSRPFPGALEAVAALQADGARIAICTNKREAWARALFDALDLTPLFPTIIGADTVGVAKPDPRPVFAALAGTGADRGVFVGDSDTDIRAAKAAGMPCLAALFGYGPLDLASEADALFSTYAEAPVLIRRALARRSL
ncbi:MAG: HAD-IA family hydrolase [Parvularculaceae bacterium]|nr:HAD-IA family hydrolase [Parvularculaceae bacterium]